MFSCQTPNCNQKDVQHNAHPDGVQLYCGICGNAMTEVTA